MSFAHFLIEWIDILSFEISLYSLGTNPVGYMIYKYFPQVCNVLSLLKVFFFSEQIILCWGPIYHFFFYGDCFWCKSKSSLLSPTSWLWMDGWMGMHIKFHQQHLLKKPFLFYRTAVVPLPKINWAFVWVYLWLLVSYDSSISFKNNLPHPLFIPFILENLIHMQKQRSVQWTPNIHPTSTITTPFLFEESSAIFLHNIPCSKFVSCGVIYLVCFLYFL